MSIEELIQCLKTKKYAKKQLDLFLQQHVNEKHFFQVNYVKYIEYGFSFYNYVRCFYLDLLNSFCVVCGKQLSYNQIYNKTTHCSSFCVKQDPIERQKHIQNVRKKLQKDGDKIKKKRIKTNLQRYGVQNPFKQQSVKQKIKQTNLKKYGVENVSFNCEIKQRIKQSNLKKYGTEYPTQNNNIKNKIINTNLKKYGCCYSFQNDVVKQKIKQTNLEKYGSINYFSSHKMKRYYFWSVLYRIKDYVIPQFSYQDYIAFDLGFNYEWQCVKCKKIFKDDVSQHFFNGQILTVPKCPFCYVNQNGISQLQKEFQTFVVKFVNCQFNDRNIIKPHELDIYIHQKNIAFQFDGLFWHSDYKIFDPNYHLKKTQKCLEKNIQLIHIFQDQWLYKQGIVKDRIKNILGVYDNRIYARKCQIKEIKSSICNQFLDINHIQGHDNSKIRLGLFYNDQLISVMTFSKPRFNKNYEYELVRFASKLGYQVIGGASKLLKYFERKYNPKSIISYADRRYSNGKLYYALGFQFLNNSEPNYWWIKNRQKYTRYQCQKYKLKQLLKQNFKQQLTEDQNMYLNGFNKIYDCGNMIFVKEY